MRWRRILAILWRRARRPSVGSFLVASLALHLALFLLLDHLYRGGLEPRPPLAPLIVELPPAEPGRPLSPAVPPPAARPPAARVEPPPSARPAPPSPPPAPPAPAQPAPPPPKVAQIPKLPPRPAPPAPVVAPPEPSPVPKAAEPTLPEPPAPKAPEPPAPVVAPPEPSPVPKAAEPTLPEPPAPKAPAPPAPVVKPAEPSPQVARALPEPSPVPPAARPAPPAPAPSAEGKEGPSFLGEQRLSLLQPRLELPRLPGEGGVKEEGRGAGESGTQPRGQVPIPLNTPDPRYQDYFQELKRRIEEHLVYPSEAARKGQSGQLLLAFVIKRDGSLRMVELQHSSGFPILDQYSVTTVQLAAPFPPIPRRIPDDSLFITASFTYVLTTDLRSLWLR